jgi:5-methylcytosine-specific restriction enzyme subunit McrC
VQNIIYEYENIPEELAKHIKTNKSLHKYFKPSFDGMKARQYCGILNLEGKDYYILPKIANQQEHNLDIFIYMLMYTYDINLSNEQLASSHNETHETIFEAFIQLFAKNILKEFTKGIYKEYITYQDNLTTLRGKYLVNENLKYNFTKAKVYCEYDEFSEDNELNQFFLYAVKTLLQYVKNKKSLKQCELVLDEVTYKQKDIKQIKINFNRINARFKQHFEFAMLLLNKSIPLFEKDKKSFAFLFDMNELFEKFVGRIYQEVDTSTKLQYTKYFGNLLLKPDIYTSNLIIDTKYKIVKNKDDLSTSDKYQMFVYGTNFGVRDAMLLYPKHIEKINEDLELGKDDKMIGLKMRSIDLDFSGGYNEYIDEVKRRLENIK